VNKPHAHMPGIAEPILDDRSAYAVFIDDQYR
jgi:hypothetical protein